MQDTESLSCAVLRLPLPGGNKVPFVDQILDSYEVTLSEFALIGRKLYFLM